MARHDTSHHVAWLAANPHRSAEWLTERLREGFDVHHVDGDHGNNDPRNLVLVEHGDHMLLHGGRTLGRLKGGWAKKRLAAPAVPASVPPAEFPEFIPGPISQQEFRLALRQLKRSQRWLAKQLAMDANTVSRWATGRHPIPGYVAYVLWILQRDRNIARGLLEVLDLPNKGRGQHRK